jgi:cysteine desulfurase
LCAMGVPPHLGQGAVRLSVGRFTTEDEIDRAAEALLRTPSPAMSGRPL